MDFTIRTAHATDRGAVEDLSLRLAEGVAEWRGPSHVASAISSWVGDALDRMDEPSQAVFVADVDGSVVGFVTVEEKEHWSGERDGYIGELVVASGHEGLGLGSALVRAAIAWVVERGLVRVSVSTGAANVRARGLYGRLGFEEEDVTLSCAV